VLKKLLADELKVRAKAQSGAKPFADGNAGNAIKKYHNKILTAAEVMDELIKLSKEIVASDDEAKQLGP
jgi:type I restriction enzyme R subunit